MSEPIWQGHAMHYFCEFLDTKRAAEVLGLQKNTLEAWRSRGGGPPFVKLGRAVRYRQSDLETWIQTRIRSNTIEKEAEKG